MARNRFRPALTAILTALTVVIFHAQTAWLEVKDTHFSVFYQPGFEQDLEFARTWMNHAEQLMKDKYGVSPDRYRISLYLLPAPNGDIGVVQSAQIQCCTRGNDGVRTGTIRFLGPSAPIWQQTTSRSDLGLTKTSEDYHAKVLMSEYIPIGHYAVKDSRPAGGWQ